MDLTVEHREQSTQPDASTNAPEGQTRHRDESHLVTEDYLKSEIEKIKEQVIQDLMVFTKEEEWRCKECELVFVSPLHVRQHILSRHFQGPMTRCKYCGIYSKNKTSLEKHVSRRHKEEKDKERTQWQITKD